MRTPAPVPSRPAATPAPRRAGPLAATAAETRVYPRAGHHLDRAALTDRTAWLDWLLRLPG